MKTILSATLLAALAGCAAVGPDYARPSLGAADIPQAWSSSAHASGSVRATSAQWWAALGSSVLDELVEQTLASNPKLDAAQARLQQVRAARDQTFASALPAVNGSASQTRSKSTAAGVVVQQASESLNASWELDLFGAVRRGAEGAQARVAASEASLQDVQRVLVADLVDAFVSYRACQASQRLAGIDLQSRIATADITELGVQAGMTAPYLAQRTKASVAEARSTARMWASQCDQLENQLTRITGTPRAQLHAKLTLEDKFLQALEVPSTWSVSLPLQAVSVRPDIQSAERSLAAASADIGLTRADQLPRLSLAGSAGFVAQGTGAGRVSFGTWSIGPTLSLPVLDGGRRAAAVEGAQARYDEALAAYRAAVRSAVEELENGLTRYAAAHERLAAARESASRYQQYLSAVDTRYREGASSLLELEDARRVWLAAQQSLLSVTQEQLQAWVFLNRASAGELQPSAP